MENPVVELSDEDLERIPKDAVAAQDAPKEEEIVEFMSDLLKDATIQSDQAIPTKSKPAHEDDNAIPSDIAVPQIASPARTYKDVVLYNSRRKPVLCAAPQLTISEQILKRNKCQELSGLQYTSNLAYPKTRKTNIQDVIIKGSYNTKIGPEINTKDLVINQHLDLTNIHSNDRLHVADPGDAKKWCFRLRYLWATLLLAAVITVAVISASVIFLTELPDEPETDDYDQPDNVPSNYSSRLVTFAQWAQHPNPSGVPDLTFRPARYVVACHTVSAFCKTTTVCTNIVRSIQSWHVNVGYAMIGYNFLIGGDGYIYEGRGWTKFGAHTKQFNCGSIGVGFIGNFDDDELQPDMIEAYNILVEEGVRRGALSENYKLFGAKQVKQSTSSPGANVMMLIKTWPHWAPKSDDDQYCP